MVYQCVKESLIYSCFCGTLYHTRILFFQRHHTRDDDRVRLVTKITCYHNWMLRPTPVKTWNDIKTMKCHSFMFNVLELLAFLGYKLKGIRYKNSNETVILFEGSNSTSFETLDVNFNESCKESYFLLVVILVLCLTTSNIVSRTNKNTCTQTKLSIPLFVEIKINFPHRVFIYYERYLVQ